MRLAIPALMSFLLPACATTPDVAPKTSGPEVGAVKEVIDRYEHELNASNVDGIARLYADDGVFMPQHVPAAVGRKAIKGLYGGILGAIDLDIVFTVDELEVIGDTAWARTRSKGTVKVIETGATNPEGNQELFVFTKRDPEGAWKIARYIFTTTNPR